MTKAEFELITFYRDGNAGPNGPALADAVRKSIRLLRESGLREKEALMSALYRWAFSAITGRS